MSGRALVIRTSRSISSIRVRRISSLIDSTRIVASIVFDRANRGLLAEAHGDGGGGCIACNRNEEEECFLCRTPLSMRGKAEALAAISRRTVRNGRKQGRDWCVGDGGSGCCPLMVSYAPLSGLALAPKKPRAAATAALRIRSARRRTL